MKNFSDEFSYCKNVSRETLESVLGGIDKYKGEHYLSMPISFDIETSSFYSEEKKFCCLYLWQMDFGGICFYGRTYDEFLETIRLIRELVLPEIIIVVYVHNLAYEFQFMRKYFTWKSVFAREKRKPIRARTNDNIEFRCSYLLSGYSLAKVADNLSSHKIEKLTEIMDYEKIRTPKTELTKQELDYARNDVKILEYYIREEIRRNNGIGRIPYTRTSYVRQHIKSKMFPKYNSKTYRNNKKLISAMTIDGEKEYTILKEAYMGGFTHANAWRVGRVYRDVFSCDLSSSYPTVMVSEKFPCGSGEYIKGDIDLEKVAENYCVIFRVSFTGLRDTTQIDHVISYSKCRNVVSASLDNGRIITADYLETTLTEVDYKYIKLFYEWDKMEIIEGYIYPKNYLPREIITSILDLYGDKTKLKGVSGKEREYLRAKEQVNSVYGMMVTNILMDEIVYMDEWDSSPIEDVDGAIEAYNTKKQRFLFYPWGVYVTSYARYNLLSTVYKVGTDYIYADTDSIKGKNYELHKGVFDEYNSKIIAKMLRMCAYYEIDEHSLHPVDIKGKEHWLGVWDFEGISEEFKTLGAKRYMMRSSGEIKTTVAGCNKKGLARYLSTFDNPFVVFNDGLIVSSEYSGRLIASYDDEGGECDVTDYRGVRCHVSERSFVHLEPSEYSMSMADEFTKLLKTIDTLLDL